MELPIRSNAQGYELFASTKVVSVLQPLCFEHTCMYLLDFLLVFLQSRLAALDRNSLTKTATQNKGESFQEIVYQQIK